MPLAEADLARPSRSCSTADTDRRFQPTQAPTNEADADKASPGSRRLDMTEAQSCFGSTPRRLWARSSKSTKRK